MIETREYVITANVEFLDALEKILNDYLITNRVVLGKEQKEEEDGGE